MLDTPILFLVFNRPENTKLVFEEIRRAKPKRLFVAADGPRLNLVNETEQCEAVRKVILSVDWECEVKTLFRDVNLGCGKAVSEAINWFFDNVEYGIVLEDDCLPEQSFFNFCEQMLIKHKENNKIAVISGTNYLYNGLNKINDDYFLSPFTPIWGWASWQRVIKKIEWNVDKLKDNLQLVQFTICFPNNKKISKWLYEVTEKTFNKNIDTWDTVFLYNLILQQTQTIIPVKNQISNIGLIGTHSASQNTPNLFSKTYSINFKEELSLNNDSSYNNILFENIEALVYPSNSIFKRFKKNKK